MTEPARKDIPIILFVEDEPNMRQLVEKVFQEKGYRILTAPNGIKAMEILVNTTPDLIISDIMMPEMNGIEFFQAVQERFGESRPVFMFLTAKNEEEDIVSGFSLGAEDYITKPVSIRHLASKIEARIKQIQTQKRHLSNGLRGNLKDQGIADIIQFIELAEHTGKLSIEAHHREGQIQFRDGQIMWSDFSPLSGTEAVVALMALDQGSFHFESTDDVIGTKRIKSDNFALILEAMKRIDEQGRETILKPVLEAESLFLSSEPASSTDPSTIDTVTAMDIPVAFPSEPEDPELSSQTQRLRAVKTDSSARLTSPVRKKALIPDWVQTVDFLLIEQSISELESGDFQGLWIDWSPPDHPAGLDINEPACVLMASSQLLTSVFRIFSDDFLMVPKSDMALPVVATRIQNLIPFRLIGFPLESAEFFPEMLQGLPGIFLLPSDTAGDMLPFVLQILETSSAPYRLIVSDDPEKTISLIQMETPADSLSGISGSFSTWLASLLSLGKCLKRFDQIKRHSAI